MVETLLAAVEMEEMLYELRDYACGMNAGRWDYIFSAIKRLQSKHDAVFPDRKLVSKNCFKIIESNTTRSSYLVRLRTAIWHNIQSRRIFC